MVRFLSSNHGVKDCLARNKLGSLLCSEIVAGERPHAANLADGSDLPAVTLSRSEAAFLTMIS
ncbi:hypothetical protein [Inquilinus sp. CA228]|uniref:hypothetical protein n=1 Tax=Inquilinus sp. CA228 TaxID=3455609 RepID=UPI003F8D8A01